MSGREPSLDLHFHFSPDVYKEKLLPTEYPLAPSTDANEQTASELENKWI